MSCLALQRCKDVAQCGTYRIYLNVSTSASYTIMFKHSSGRINWLQKTSTTALVNSLNLSYVEFTATEMSGFLESYGDFEISVIAASQSSIEDATELYLYEVDSTAVYAYVIIVNFKPTYSGTARTLPTNVTTEIFKAC